MLTEMARESGSIYCLTHAPDFDGISSAALLVHYLGVEPGNVMFAFPDLKDFRPAVESLLGRGPKNALVIFTDLSVNDDAADYLVSAVSSLKRMGNKVAWIDHHPWSQAAVDALRKACDFLVCGEGDMCAAELVIRELAVNDDYANTIRDIAHIMDFNLPVQEDRQEMVYNLARAITEFKVSEERDAMLRRMVSIVSSGSLQDSFITEAAKSYVRKSEREVALLKEDCRAFDVNGYRIGIGHARDIQSTQACAVIEERLKTDIEVFINTDGYHLNMRSRKGIDCSPIAIALGGGGHPQAAGATPKIEGKPSAEMMEGLLLDAARKALRPRVKQEEATDEPAHEVTIGEFSKIDLRVARIVSASELPGKKKLYAIELDVGSLGRRQIAAGLRGFYSKEELVGRDIIIVANLGPKKLGEFVSHGMLLAAEEGGKVALLEPDKQLPPGARVF